MYYFEKDRREGDGEPYNILKWEFTGTEKGGRRSICFPHHNHDIFEIITVLSGHLLVGVEDCSYELTRGSAVIVNPFEIHSGECTEHTVYLCLTLNLRSVTALSPALSGLSASILGGKKSFEHYHAKEEQTAKDISEALEKLYLLRESSGEKASFDSCSVLFRLLGSICSVLSDNKENPRRDTDKDFMRAAAIFLSENYTQDIGTAEICEALHYEMSGFCHKFRRCFGDSFSNYLCKYRITRACEKFRGTDVKVSKIAASSGFGDYSYFSRCFKKYIGASPREYFSK